MKKRTVWMKVYSPDTGWYYIGGPNEDEVLARANEMAAMMRHRHPRAVRVRGA